MAWRALRAFVYVLACLVQPWWSLPRLRDVAAASCASPQGVSALVARSHGALLAGTQVGEFWQSSPDGQCWSLLQRFRPSASIGLLYAPAANSALLLAGGSRLSDIGLYLPLHRGVDGGNTWATALTGLPAATLPLQLDASADGALLLS